MTVNSSSLPERIISILASSWVIFVAFWPLIDRTRSPAVKPFSYAGVFGFTFGKKMLKILFLDGYISTSWIDNGTE
jgi:hypothetical protein